MSSKVFFDYYTDDTPPKNVIRSWYLDQDARVCAAFDAVLTLLELKETKEEWLRTGLVKELHRQHTGLTELIIDIKDKRPFRHVRPVGVWHPGERIFILLTGCEKSGRIYAPAGAFSDALKYKMWLETGRGVISEHI